MSSFWSNVTTFRPVTPPFDADNADHELASLFPPEPQQQYRRMSVSPRRPASSPLSRELFSASSNVTGNASVKSTNSNSSLASPVRMLLQEPGKIAGASSPLLPPPTYVNEQLGAADISFFGSSTQGGLRYEPPEHTVSSSCRRGELRSDDVEMIAFSPQRPSSRGARSSIASFISSLTGRGNHNSSNDSCCVSQPQKGLRGATRGSISPTFPPSTPVYTPHRGSSGSGSGSRVPFLQQQRRACPASPPPTYPSPPTYRTPPRSAYALGMAPDATPLLTGMDLSQIYEDEIGDLAPAYKDDVGCWQGLHTERNCGGLLMTLLLYSCVTVLTAAALGLIPWLKVTPNEFRSVFLVAYGVYMIENLGSKTSSYLWRLNGEDEDGRERIRTMLEMPPWIRWTLHSYHYPNAMAAQEGKPGNRIRTGTKRGEYAIFGCADATNTRPFTSHQLCKLNFKMVRDFRDAEAEARYEAAKQQFIDDNKTDSGHTLIETWGINRWVSQLIVVRNGESMPWWASWLFFFVMCLCGQGLWYRIFFAARTGRRTCKISKVIW